MNRRAAECHRTSCEHCGESFLPHRPSQMQRFCSRACVLMAAQEAKKPAFVSGQHNEWTEWHEFYSDKISLVAGIDCWLWDGSLGRGGHGRVNIGGKVRYAHREAYRAFNGSTPSRLIVRHLCGVAACVRPAHLSLGTAADNARDTAEMFRSASRLRHEDVRLARRMYEEGASLAEIAQAINVAYGSVYPIVSGHSFRHFERDTARKALRCERKMTAEKVAEMRRRLADGGVTNAQLAKEYGLSSAQVSRIKTGARW